MLTEVFRNFCALSSFSFPSLIFFAFISGEIEEDGFGIGVIFDGEELEVGFLVPEGAGDGPFPNKAFLLSWRLIRMFQYTTTPVWIPTFIRVMTDATLQSAEGISRISHC
jgi:hypothetical protein